MTMRKLCAGLAAAAALLGGLAIGAATANAAQGDLMDLTQPQSITITGTKEALAGRTLKAVLLGKYDQAIEGADGKVASVSVITDDAVKTGADTALTAVKPDWETDTAHPGYAGNPIGYVAAANLTDSGANGTPAWQGELRQFITQLQQQTDFQTALSAAAEQKVSTDATSLTIGNLTPGLYAVVDVTASSEASGAVTNSLTMVVPTKVNDQDLENMELGTVQIKNRTMTKTSDKDDEDGAGDGTVNIGDNVTYSINAYVPNTDGYTNYDFAFTDIPGIGLTVAAGTVPSVSVVDAQGDVQETLTAGTDYTVTGLDSELKGDGAKSFSVDIKEAKILELGKKYAGYDFVMTYTATVNDEATSTVDNKFKVTNDGDYNGGGNSLKNYGFEFTKVQSDGTTAVAGAQFQIKDAGGNVVKVLAQTESGAYKKSVDANAVDTVVTPTNGVVKVSGLAAGTYTVTETKPADGYLQSVKPSFKVTIAKDGTVTYTKDSDIWDAVSITDGKVTVKNFASITQLPLTGGAGIMLFTAVGILLAGAAATVFAKSRSTRRALMA